MMLDPLYDIGNPLFTGTIFRKNEDDIMQNGGLWDKAKLIYPNIGGVEKFSGKKFVFPSRSQINFSHLNNESTKAIESRFKGLEMPFIAIDEIDQIEFSTVKLLITSNRNSNGIRNRFLGSCNPSCDTWLRQWIDWYIDEDGYIIPARDGVVRYFFLNGEAVTDVVWGNTKDEVYKKCRGIIDMILSKMNDGVPKAEWTTSDMLIKDFVFIEGSLSENKKLTDSDPSYKANIAMGTDEDRQRNILGCWNISNKVTEQMVSKENIEGFFNNAEQRDGIRRMSVDVALQGADMCVAVEWDGLHITNVSARPKIDDGKILRDWINTNARFSNIKESGIYYDEIGVGSVMREMTQAHGFNANSKPFNDDATFSKAKDQVMWTFGNMLINGLISIDEALLSKKINYGKMGFCTVREILADELRALRIVESSGKITMIPKKAKVGVSMKSILGHSPDFLEACVYGIIHIFEKTKTKSIKKGLYNL